jgi:hypothetical protein
LCQRGRSKNPSLVMAVNPYENSIKDAERTLRRGTTTMQEEKKYFVVVSYRGRGDVH